MEGIPTQVMLDKLHNLPLENHHLLLLACLQKKSDPKWISDQMKLMTEGEWASFSESITRQGVTPLIYKRLKQNSLTELLPHKLFSYLQYSYFSNTAKVVRLTDAYFQIKKAFEVAGIKVIALKGVHLANSVYQHPGERQMCDLDILVPKKDLYRASCILAECGYQSQREITEDELTEDMEKHLPPFYSRNGSLMLELHWNIANQENNLSVAIEHLWDQSTIQMVNDLEMNVLCPADLLLHLCIHSIFSHDLEINLKTLCDISLLIEHHGDKLHYDDIILTAKKWELGKSVFLMLELVNNLLCTSIPDQELSTIRYKSTPLMTQHAIDIIFHTKSIKFSNDKVNRSLPYSRPLIKKYNTIIPLLFPSLHKTLRVHKLPKNTSPLIAYGIHYREFIRIKAQKLTTFLFFNKSSNKPIIQEYKTHKALMDWIAEP